MHSTFKNNDVCLLLKDLTGAIEPLPSHIREQFIQKGIHYCEMLPEESKPSEKYFKIYSDAIDVYGQITADAIALLSEKIYHKKNGNITLVSIARAGIPVGILVKRYLEKKYSINIKHYAISIIRERGIDCNAINFILKNHLPETVQFIDGWTGKGVIYRELISEIHNKYPNLSSQLAVVADPANITDLCGTHEDILIPNSCFNSTITGMISRTILNDKLIGTNDFHGAVFYEELLKYDITNEYLDTIANKFNYNTSDISIPLGKQVDNIIKNIAKTYNINDINHIKPGIGETTRVLLRRVPHKVLINRTLNNYDDLKGIIQLASEKNVVVEECCIDLGNYKVCGIIKQLSDV
ncbi:MAG: cysteine protease StiP family protein [Deferribacterales bacterium]|nr:cysteine protease StiP family protein [Deferribacterales bacterium]